MIHLEYKNSEAVAHESSKTQVFQASLKKDVKATSKESVEYVLIQWNIVSEKLILLQVYL